MDKIDIKKYYINNRDGGITPTKTNSIYLIYEILEKVNEIIEKINNLETFTGNNLK